MWSLEERKESLITSIEDYIYVRGNGDSLLYKGWIEEVKDYTTEHQIECMEQLMESLWDY